mmetsp:Transcript_26682/g.55703  ORF Transcript_26682/g.55703 Transcript_26682/m.55703 type:complete len:271 (+) Transcript_26682:149-961(+)
MNSTIFMPCGKIFSPLLCLVLSSSLLFFVLFAWIRRPGSQWRQSFQQSNLPFSLTPLGHQSRERCRRHIPRVHTVQPHYQIARIDQPQQLTRWLERMYHGTLRRRVNDDAQGTRRSGDVEQLVLPTRLRPLHAHGGAEAVACSTPGRSGVSAIALGREGGHNGPSVVLIADHLLDVGVVEVIAEVAPRRAGGHHFLDLTGIGQRGNAGPDLQFVASSVVCFSKGRRFPLAISEDINIIFLLFYGRLEGLWRHVKSGYFVLLLGLGRVHII